MLRIIAPTDFSTDGYNATLVAMQLARLLSAEVIFVHAMAKPPVPATAPEGLFLSLYQEEERKTRNRLHEECQHLTDILNLRHGEVLYRTLVVPTPFSESMLQLIARENIDLIVMGSRGSSNLKQILIGSNTLELLRRTPVPLLVIPSDSIFNGFSHIAVLLEQQTLPERKGLDMLRKLLNLYQAKLHFLILTKDGEMVRQIEETAMTPTAWHGILEHGKDTTQLAEADALVGMGPLLSGMGVDLLVLLPEQQSIWESLFSKNITEELAARAHMPLLALP